MQNFIISHSGIRGRVGETLTWKEAYKAFYLFYHLYLKDKTPLLILGKDPKSSGEELLEGIMGYAKKTGIKIKFLGITSLPVVEWAVKHFRAGGGVIVTASHNPIPWNGLKFISSWDDGASLLPPDLMKSFREEWEKLKGGINPEKYPLSREEKNYLEVYFQEMWEIVGNTIDKVSGKKGLGKDILSSLNKLPFTVILDATCEEGAKIAGGFLKFIGIKNIKVINRVPIEKSQRRLEPSPENLSNLKEEIEKERKAIGFATDPDQDRLVTLPLKSEELTPLLAGKFLMELQKENEKKMLSKIVINLSTSSAWEEIGGKFGVEIVRAPVGEINVVEKMRELKTFFGAEGHGGVILLPATPGRNSHIGMALILGYLIWSGKDLGKLEEEIPSYVMWKGKLESPSTYPERWLKNAVNKLLAEKKENVKSLDHQDGFKIIFKDLSWVHLRPSNTEPIVRIFVEKRTENEKEVKEFYKEILRIISSFSPKKGVVQ